MYSPMPMPNTTSTKERIMPQANGRGPALEREAELWRHAVGAHQRLSFLGEASRVLGESLEPRQVLARLAKLAVPTVADWCLIDLLNENGELELAGEAGSARVGVRRDAHGGRQKVLLRGGKPLDPGSYVCVPLTAGRRAIGALSFGRSTGAPLNAADLQLGRELAARAAAAIENARLYQKSRRADEMLTLALSANRMVAWSWDLATGAVTRSANAAEIYGLRPGAQIARGHHLIHPLDRARYKAAVARALASGSSYVERFSMVRADGAVAWMEEHGTPTGRARLSGVVMDITTQKLAEDQLKLEREVAAIVSEAAGLDDAMPRLLASVGLVMGWTLGFAWIPGADGELAAAGRWAHRAGRRRERAVIPSSAGALARAVLLNGRASWVCGLSVPAHQRAAARQACAFAFPLLGEKGVLGVLEFHGDGAAITDDRRNDLFGRLGRQIGAFLERKRAAADLELRRREQQMILDAVPAMIWYKDAKNVVLRCNLAAARWFGRPAEQIEGRSAFELFPDRGAEYHRDDLSVIRTGKPKLGLVEECVSPGGARCWVRRDIIPNRDHRGRCTGVVVFAVDVTEIKRAEATLRESERAQRDFVANVSHEFRTPVAAIKGFAETLRRGGLEDKKNRLGFVRTIESHADRLDWLVQDLINLSRLGSGMVKLKKLPLQIKPFLEDYLASVASVVDRRGVHTVVDAAPDLVALADRPHLVQVLDNLLSNALKHSPKGSKIRLEGRMDQRKIRVTVRDEGTGIPVEHLPRLFDRFYRVDKGDGGGSTGLGLHIVKTIVEAQGGKVWVESEIGRGSAFHLTLPRAQA